MCSYWRRLADQANNIRNDFNDGGAAIIPLSELGQISVEGGDSTQLLQSLLTNDIEQLNIGQSQYSGFCTSKGRLSALFLVSRMGEQHYRLILPSVLCPEMAKRLERYIFRSQVHIQDLSGSWCCMGINHPNKKSLDNLEKSQEFHNEPKSVWFFELPNESFRVLLLSEKQSVERIYPWFEENDYQLASEYRWQRQDIQEQIAQIFPETQEKFTPQQLNLDLNDTVNFKKGCYPGQEVVARLHYLGKPSRRMLMARAETEIPTKPGDEVTDKQGKTAGHIVRFCHCDNELHCLVSIKLAFAEQPLQLSDGKALVIERYEESEDLQSTGEN